MFKVAILGSGPAGLIAAHAAATDGRVDEVHIYSRGEKSTMYGAQYLHAPIPGATFDDPINIDYVLRGTRAAYRAKVYGENFNGHISPEDLGSNHQAWDIRKTYDWLWMAYSPSIHALPITPGDVAELLDDYDLVVSSVPAPAICHSKHTFRGTNIWAAGEAPELGIVFASAEACPEGTVVCNGLAFPAWYRISRIYGRMTVEWPGWVDAQHVPKTAALVTKPTASACDCWYDSEAFLRVGRYGTWLKGVLSHEAYLQVQERIDAIAR